MLVYRIPFVFATFRDNNWHYTITALLFSVLSLSNVKAMFQGQKNRIDLSFVELKLKDFWEKS